MMTVMWKRVDGLRTLGLHEPGAFCDELNALVLAGKKIATAGLWRVDYEPDDEHIENVGERLVLLDSDDEALAQLVVARVESHPFLEVPWELARDEGEGCESLEGFRSGYRAVYGQRGVSIADDDAVVCVWFDVRTRY